MKYLLSVVTFATLFFSCKKDLGVCKDYKEITGREKGVDVSSIQAKEIHDTLLKYPQLQVYQLQSTPYNTSINCRVYYQDLLIFSDDYALFKNLQADTLSSSGSILTSTLSLSLIPSISYKDAIKKARLHVNLDHSCISYQLGLYNRNRWYNLSPDYRLAWKISDSQNPYIYVIVDAANGSVLYSENGVYWVN
jgi:hypothetical protein